LLEIRYHFAPNNSPGFAVGRPLDCRLYLACGAGIALAITYFDPKTKDAYA
jgi:hypothetical protein